MNAPTAVSPDSMQGVAGQTVVILQDIENKLITILQRIRPTEKDTRLGGETCTAIPNGILNQMNLARNTASRIVDIIHEIDALV